MGLGGREQVGVDLNRLQRGKQWTSEDRWREAERVHALLCCLLRRRMSPCPFPFPLSGFLPPSLYSSVPGCSALIYRQHFPCSFYQCHKSNVLPLRRWITVFQQTQQSNALVPPHPTIYPSLPLTSPTARDIQTHLHWTTL